MYDSYNEYYELYEKLEKPPVTVIEPVGGGTDRKRTRRTKPPSGDLSRGEAVLAEERESFRAAVRQNLRIYDRIIQAEDTEIVRMAYLEDRNRIQAVHDMDIDSFEDLEYAWWYYNDGLLRTQAEVQAWQQGHDQAIQGMEQFVQYGSTEYKVQKFFFALLMLLAIWFCPGWVVALVQGESGDDFHIVATLVNLGVLFFLHPVQLVLSALACTSDGFLRMEQDPKVTEERRRARRFAAGTAAVTAVLSARNISRTGRSLMSGKERL